MPIPSNVPRSYAKWNGVTSTPSDFNLDAGRYGITLAAGGFTTLTISRFLDDGSQTGSGTYVPVTAALAPTSYTVVELPAGRYRAVLVGTALNGAIEQIAPGRQGG